MASLCVNTQIRTPYIITKSNDRDAELYHRLENTREGSELPRRSAGPSPFSLIVAEFLGMRRGSDSPSFRRKPLQCVSKTEQGVEKMPFVGRQ
jgi:hypothetical protein